MRSVRFMSRRQAEALSPCPETVVVSITTPGDAPADLQAGFLDILRVAFDDLYEEALSLPLGDVPDDTPDGTAIRWKVFELPRAAHAQRICHFLAKYSTPQESVALVVHCDAGISRSAAVAQFVADKYDAPIVNLNPDTSCANERLLRLLNKVDNGFPLDIRPSPDIDALRDPHRRTAALAASVPTLVMHP